MPTLILLIGLPGSGKSTLAQQLTAQDEQWRLISTDRIRLQLYGDEAIQGNWAAVWREVRQQFVATVGQCFEGRALGAVYDATNAVRKQRRRVIAVARSHQFTQIQGLWLDVPLEVCLERNRGRSRRVPEEILLQMHRRLVGAPPALSEGLDSLVKLSGLEAAAHTPTRG